MRINWISALVATAAMALLSYPACAQGAKTPKDCIDGINKCAAANDVDGMMKLIAEPAASPMRKMFKSMKALYDAQKKLIGAVDGKWGAGSAKKMGLEETPLDLSDMTIRVTDIKENGDEATATGKNDSGQPETYYFKKTKDGWFMNPMKEDGAAEKMKSLDKTARLLNGAAASFESLAADIKSGMCATTEDLGRRLKAISKEMSEGEK